MADYFRPADADKVDSATGGGTDDCEAGLLRQIQRMLKQDIAMEPVKGFEPSRPIRVDNAPFAAPRGPRPQRGHRPHGKPAQAQPRHAHAGPKQHRGQGAGKPAGRRDSRA